MSYTRVMNDSNTAIEIYIETLCKRINLKTSWGKVELQKELYAAKSDALMAVLSKFESEKYGSDKI